CRKSAVELVSEWGVAPTDLVSDLIKLHNVFRESLVARHSEVREFGFRVLYRIVGTEVQSEFLFEGVVIKQPVRRKCSGFRDLWFEVVERCSFEVGQREVNFVFVVQIVFGAIAEIELEL